MRLGLLLQAVRKNIVLEIIAYAAKGKVVIDPAVRVIYAAVGEMAETVFYGKGDILFKEIMQADSAVLVKIKLRALFAGMLGHIKDPQSALKIRLQFPALGHKPYF